MKTTKAGYKMKHKWHKEIKAWADGAEIEYRVGDESWILCNKPTWEKLGMEYRIKPQPKEPQYLYAYAKTGSTQVEMHRGFKANNIEELHGIRYLGKIKLEVDDEPIYST